jgi:uncharacterized protein (DUF1501 family)
MAMNRRQFIKQSAGAVSVSLVLPKLWMAEARGQSPADASRKIFIVCQLAGGNDGLNTVIPYSDDRYHALRPRIGFQDSELTSTIISNQFALHPSMTALKGLYDAGKVAIVLGVGDPNGTLSHFTQMDIWQDANPNNALGSEGWLGRYADHALAGQSGLSAVSVGGTLPKSFFSNKVVIPNIANFNDLQFQTDGKYANGRANQMAVFNNAYGSRTFPDGTYISSLTSVGADAVNGAAQIKTATATYRAKVTYPNTGLANGFQMLASIITTIPQSSLLYVSMGGFDNHAVEIGMPGDLNNRLVGAHASLLKQFSDAIKAFYDDMTAFGLADNIVIMTWSEFGRRAGDNASNGTDHGTASPQFVIGNPVKGGALYGAQPSLAATALDSGGNMQVAVDFRAMYATILDGWLGTDSQTILGQKYDHLGFF